MSFFHYTRTRERSPYDDEDDKYYARPLVRRDSKRQRTSLYDDDEYDDYPASKPSRALTIRQPSQVMEKYNVWSRPTHHESDHDHDHDHDDGDEHHHHSSRRYRYVHKHYTTQPAQSDDDKEDNREREFRLKVRATFGRPKSSSSKVEKAFEWPGEIFKRREKLDRVEWETRERERERESKWWDDEPREYEKTVRFRRIKRTRTDEWKPLSGWKRH